MWITLLATTVQPALGWGLHWIACPQADSTSQVLFRHTYRFDRCPRKGHISIACNGRYVVYINGYNVSADVMEPGVTPLGTATCIRTYDVGRYLQADSNVVAVWYSPVSPCRPTDRQLAMTFSGIDGYARPYAYHTDGDWLCRLPGFATTPDGNEEQDATLTDVTWLQPSQTSPAWLGVATADEQPGKTVSRQPECYDLPLWHTVLRPVHIYNYQYFDVDGQKVTYRFAKAFNGWIRLTFRGMKAGAEVRVNGLRYICSGETDEQACRRFTTTWQDKAEVVMPPGTTTEQIQNVEGIEIAPWPYRKWR